MSEARTKKCQKRRPLRPPEDFGQRLAEGVSYTVIASDYGVTRNTIARWAQRPEVLEELAALRAERIRYQRSRLDRLFDPAVNVVEGALTGKMTVRCPHCAGEHEVSVPTRTAEALRAAEIAFDRGSAPRHEIHEHAGEVRTGRVDLNLSALSPEQLAAIVRPRGTPGDEPPPPLHTDEPTEP